MCGGGGTKSCNGGSEATQNTDILISSLFVFGSFLGDEEVLSVWTLSGRTSLPGCAIIKKYRNCGSNSI